MAQYLKKKLENCSQYIVLNDVDINSVMFLYVQNNNKMKMTVDEINNFNKKIKEKIDVEGKYFLHQFPIRDDKQLIEKDAIVYPLRYMSGNDNITMKDIDTMLEYIDSIAKSIKQIGE